MILVSFPTLQKDSFFVGHVSCLVWAFSILSLLGLKGKENDDGPFQQGEFTKTKGELAVYNSVLGVLQNHMRAGV